MERCHGMMLCGSTTSTSRSSTGRTSPRSQCSSRIPLRGLPPRGLLGLPLVELLLLWQHQYQPVAVHVDGMQARLSSDMAIHWAARQPGMVYEAFCVEVHVSGLVHGVDQGGQQQASKCIGEGEAREEWVVAGDGCLDM